ncbi:hypothetical protein [Paenibacillus sp. ACRRY]|uniref:hypothetical protein n=1 Tax=Paenibacillus sp. ACRRY TaxID=2918208 RepID=UPI001EF56525|nr:hypothetical protein [Paenibacillus sp. ACRRY]MCG7386821.1 hypothetical protein [Paenibacillus sp. ACRRY]
MTIAEVALISITVLLMIIGVRSKRKSVLRWGIASFIALIIFIIPAFINGFVDGFSDGWSAR